MVKNPSFIENKIVLTIARLVIPTMVTASLTGAGWALSRVVASLDSHAVQITRIERLHSESRAAERQATEHISGQVDLLRQYIELQTGQTKSALTDHEARIRAVEQRR